MEELAIRELGNGSGGERPQRGQASANPPIRRLILKCFGPEVLAKMLPRDGQSGDSLAECSPTLPPSSESLSFARVEPTPDSVFLACLQRELETRRADRALLTKRACLSLPARVISVALP